MRTKREVVLDERRKGVNAYPSFHPNFFLNNPIKVDGKKIVPLGSISNVFTVYCSELGPYLTYTTDRFGFHNPPGVWDSQPVRAAFLGDSFTQGACVSSENSFSRIVEKMIGPVINLGSGSNGPFAKLAGLREYLPLVRPDYVFWVYFEGNDFIDYYRSNLEKKSDIEREFDSLLKRYLDPTFRLELPKYQVSIDARLKHIVESDIRVPRRADTEKEIGLREMLVHTMEFLTLQKILVMIFDNVTIKEHQNRQDSLELMRQFLPLYRKILSMARDEVKAWSGELIVLYLPTATTLVGHPQFMKKELEGIWSDLEIAVVDMTPEFMRHANPPSLSPGHYNEEGYALVADRIVQFIETR